MTRLRRCFLRVTCFVLLLCLPLFGSQQFDVVVVGGTPGGIAAAITAARLGHAVALVEYHPHLGAMSASGLGKSDIETREAIGGLFEEFVGRVYKYYVDRYGADSENVKLCRDGYYYEPSVAEKIFDEMIADEPKISVFVNHRLEEVVRHNRSIVSARVVDRSNREVKEFRGGVFVDATYEGDLAAYAGTAYRLGREAREDFNELHAGVVYQDYETRTFLAGSTGEGDRRLPAYTYRLCLTDDPANSVILKSPPPDYDRTRYLDYLDDLEAGRLGPPRRMKEGVGYYSPHFNTMVRVFSFAEIPNQKFDVNMNPRPLGFPFAEENYHYPDAGWEEREKISRRIRNITLGLLYFIQNDAEVDEEHRTMARQYHLARDEFSDNEHFPFQLYVREARRIKGEYTLSENDVELAPGSSRTPIHQDSIAAGEFPIDSFPVRKREEGHDVALEGYVFMADNVTRPYQIPYRILVPEKVNGLLVPVAASTTHVAFSTIRMEPTWMALGQAAGAAAHLALAEGKQPRNVRPERLQRLLLKQGQVVTYFEDIDKSDPAFKALQFFGAKGFFTDYRARSREPLSRSLAARWLTLALKVAEGEPRLGRESKLRWKDFGPGSPGFEEAVALAAVGIVKSPDPGASFHPNSPLSRPDFVPWLLQTGRLLGLWESSQSTEATLNKHELGAEIWVDPSNKATQNNDLLSRGEFCRALFLMLDKAGY